LQQKIADAAGVHKSLVTIRVTAASVIITATIGVPASMTADQVQTSLSSSLGTAEDASTALGITVEEVPTANAQLPLAPSPPSPPDHCSVQDCERNVAESQADYQQAVAAGQKDMCRMDFAY